MRNLTKIGTVFFGLSIAVIGFQTIFFRYIYQVFLPPHHFGDLAHVGLAYILGIFLLLCGVAIVFAKNARTLSLILGWILLLIVCLYYIPYEFMSGADYRSFGEWENAEKELALAGGAFIMTFTYPNSQKISGYAGRIIPAGPAFYAVSTIAFGIDHFLYAKDASTLVPLWIPAPMFWTYLAGAGLIASGIAILLKIKVRLAATLLGTIILIWFLILHIPRAIASPFADMGGEVTNSFLALAYSGIAFAIAGNAKNPAAFRQ